MATMTEKERKQTMEALRREKSDLEDRLSRTEAELKEIDPDDDDMARQRIFLQGIANETRVSITKAGDQLKLYTARGRRG